MIYGKFIIVIIIIIIIIMAIIMIIIINSLSTWFGDRNSILPVKKLFKQSGTSITWSNFGKIGWLNKQMERRQLWASCSHTLVPLPSSIIWCQQNGGDALQLV